MEQVQMLNLRREYEHTRDEIDAAIRSCLDHQQWILGPEVREFESLAAQYLGVKHCVGTSSGTEALLLALRALAILLTGKEHFKKTDEIITTPFTFTATGDTIVRAGATPVFVDIELDTYNIDPARVLDYYLTAAERTPRRGRVVGVLPVHLYGKSCEIGQLMETAERFEGFLVEDVAQGFGATFNKKKLGSLGIAAAFSFFPSKNLGAFGDAGLLATHQDSLDEVARMLTKHGGKDKYDVRHLGYNSRLDTVQAAVLMAKLKYVDEFNERRRRIAQIYDEQFLELDGLVIPGKASGQSNSEHVYHQYTVRIIKGHRDDLQQYLSEHGVSSMVYYPKPLHMMHLFKGRSKVHGKLRNAELSAKTVLSLPINPFQTDEQTLYVAHFVKDYFAQLKSR